MAILKSKAKATAISLFLMLAMAVTLVVVPLASAHDPAWTIPTYAYLNVDPNPVGVGQEVFVNFWVNMVPPTAYMQFGDRWEGYEVTVTKPDGNTEKLGPFRSDDAGGAWTQYTPNTIGTYKFVFNFPGQTIVGANPHPVTGTFNPQYVGDYFKPSTSKVVELIVQEEPIELPPETPLPTEYWTRPIQSGNTAWYTISGNWLRFGTRLSTYNTSNCFAPYTTAPNTAHIMWTKPIAFGGLVGAEFGNDLTSNYYSASQYEAKFTPVIINGILYYELSTGSQTHIPGWVAADLRTGEQLWFKDTTTTGRLPITTGQVYHYVSPNQYQCLAYLWSQAGTTLKMYDAMMGNWILDIVNGTFGQTWTQSEDGSLLGYYVNNTDHTLNMWNSSRAIIKQANLAGGNIEWSWRPPQGAQIDWRMGIEWTKPLATTIAGNTITPNLSIMKIASDVVVLTNMVSFAEFRWQPGWIIVGGYSAITGDQMWLKNQTFTPWTRITYDAAGDGVYPVYTCETQTWEGFSLKTGEKLWGPVGPYTTVWGYHGTKSLIAYGNFYTYDMGGYANCFDLQTGEHKWQYYTGNSGLETPYGAYPFWIFDVGTIADGKIYIGGGHEYSPPLFKGSKLWCLNATTGEEIWKIMSFPVSCPPAIADGYMVSLNAYDNLIYCYGKGPSATTVAVSPKITVHGDSVLVEGTVTDESSGAQDSDRKARFPHGVPAIADENMSAWMEYVYMQQPKPTDINGVEVVIEVLDPNNNYYEVGRTTCDDSGFYKLSFTPPVPGEYTIVAMFEGSESYYSSYAETAINVEDAPVATPEPTPTPASVADLYFLPVSTGMIIAIVIVLALLILMLRRRT